MMCTLLSLLVLRCVLSSLLCAGLLEFPQALAQAFGEFGNFLPAKEQGRDGKNEQQFLHTYTEHLSSFLAAALTRDHRLRRCVLRPQDLADEKQIREQRAEMA